MSSLCGSGASGRVNRKCLQTKYRVKEAAIQTFTTQPTPTTPYKNGAKSRGFLAGLGVVKDQIVVVVAALVLLAAPALTAHAANVTYLNSATAEDVWNWSAFTTLRGGWGETTSCSSCWVRIQTYKNALDIYDSAANTGWISNTHDPISGYAHRCRWEYPSGRDQNMFCYYKT